MTIQTSMQASPSPKRKARGVRVALAGSALLALGLATPAQAHGSFEQGFQDEMGRLLAHEAVHAGRAILAHGIAEVHYRHAVREYRHRIGDRLDHYADHRRQARRHVRRHLKHHGALHYHDGHACRVDHHDAAVFDRLREIERGQRDHARGY